MTSSKLSPADFWDRHVKNLQSIHAKRKEADAHLERVKEKRTSPRIRSLNLTSYVPKKGEQQEYIISIGRTLDVSEGGAKLETHRHLDPGTKLELDVAVQDKIISARGEVVHSEDLGNGLFGIGIRFTDISEEERRLLRR